MNKQTAEALEKRYSLEGKRGIVTGGSAGLGKGISLTLAEVGAEVFVFSRSGEFKGDQKSDSENIHHITADVTDRVSCKKYIDEIGSKGLDFLVNNAGISERVKVTDIDPEIWRKIQAVNVEAVYTLCQFAHPYLSKAPDAGRIINISSMAAHLGFSEVVPYVASKSAVLGMTRGLGVEWAQDNILVNSISPGWFKTELLDKILDEEREKKILNRMPLHRYGKLDELADVVLFLVSPAASYITGQDIPVDGGALAFGY
jgi:NAD(P)-dependent dehydrogenase (short-subunit alcohol dehydrogenase family)